MDEAKIMKAVSDAVSAIQVLSEEGERERALKAVLAIFGTSKGKEDGDTGEGASELEGVEVSSKAKMWMKQNGISAEQLANVVHLEGNESSVIASIPGKGKRGQTINAYVLQGLLAYLKSGEVNFEDDVARKLCDRNGCYDSANHAVIMKERGNLWTGTKESGWKLTAPGLKHAAGLIKELTQQN